MVSRQLNDKLLGMVRRKLFICHASEDKAEIAAPLADALLAAGYLVWYDQYSLVAGESLKRSIDAGLAECDYGIVILSKSFFQKRWPREELDGLTAIESARDARTVIPLWHGVDHEYVVRHSPTLAGKKAILTNVGMEGIVAGITQAVDRVRATGYVDRVDTLWDTLVAGGARPEPVFAVNANMVKRSDVTWQEFGKALSIKVAEFDEDEETNEPSPADG